MSVVHTPAIRFSVGDEQSAASIFPDFGGPGNWHFRLESIQFQVVSSAPFTLRPALRFGFGLPDDSLSTWSWYPVFATRFTKNVPPPLAVGGMRTIGWIDLATEARGSSPMIGQGAYGIALDAELGAKLWVTMWGRWLREVMGA